MLNIISDYIPGEQPISKLPTNESIDTDFAPLIKIPNIDKGSEFKFGKLTIPDTDLGNVFSGISAKLDVGKLKANLESTLNDLFEVFSQINNSNKNIFIDAVKLNLSLSATGEVSILSLLKGGVGSVAGIEFTIKFKEN